MPSCHDSGVTPRNMKTGGEDSKAYFRIKRNRLKIFPVKSHLYISA
jgi:hypothetical protein